MALARAGPGPSLEPTRWALVVALSLFATTARADGAVRPWERLGDSLGDAFGWPGVLFHVAAVAVTPPLVYGADREVQDWFQHEDPFGEHFGEVMLITGGVTPAAIPAAIYATGLAAPDAELASAGAALVQAEVIQFFVVSTLKWLTDRAGPHPDGDPNARRWHSAYLRDSADPTDFDFNPFDLSWGLRWPSGHTASNMTLVSTLTAFYPDELWIPLLGYPFVAAVAIGMVEGDYHWLSDVIPAALIGHVIGWAVGTQFRRAYDQRNRGVLTPGGTTVPLLQFGGRF